MNTYRTFKRSAKSWEEFAQARKITVESGLDLEEAIQRCREFNRNRSYGQIQKGTKLEFEEE